MIKRGQVGKVQWLEVLFSDNFQWTFKFDSDLIGKYSITNDMALKLYNRFSLADN